MALFKFGDALPQFTQLQDIYDGASLKLKSHSATKAVYEDKNGASIVLAGKGLHYNGSEITAGTVKSVEFDDGHGDTLLDVTRAKFHAKTIAGTLEDHPNVFNFLSALSAGNDQIHGSDSVADTMSVGLNHGNDAFFLGSAGGYADGTVGNDTYKGGAGFDILSYEDTYYFSDAKKGIVANLATGKITDSWGDKDVAAGVDELRGSIFNDKITGSKNDESFMGLKGSDVIDGGVGEDTARYDRDAVYGGKNGIDARLGQGVITDGFGDKDKVKHIEDVDGTARNDHFVGDAQNNQFHGLAGKDTFDGGDGTDSVSFYWTTDIGEHGVKVDLSRNTGQIADDGFGNVETTKSIEAAGGSLFNDTITLGAADGWAAGYAGDDMLVAGTGVQQFYGGTGKDTFTFNDAQAIGTEQDHRDYIDDFSQSDNDKIDFSGIGLLQFKGEGGTAAQGEVRYVTQDGFTFVYGEVDGQPGADFDLVLKGKITLTPTISICDR